MFALIREIMRLAVALAIEGNRLEGNQDVAQNQDDVGPLMTNDISLAMIERFGIFRVQTGPVLQRTVDEDDDLPGQPFDALERLGQLSGLCFREIFQRGDGHLGMRFQQVRKEGFMQSGKPGGFFEGMFRCRDHQKEQIAGTNPLKPLTDGDPTFDPSLDGASEHRASPWCEHANMGGGDDSIGQESRCPSLFGKDVICGIPRTASL